MMMEYIFLVLESKAIKDREINICRGLEGISLEVEGNQISSIPVRIRGEMLT